MLGYSTIFVIGGEDVSTQEHLEQVRQVLKDWIIWSLKQHHDVNFKGNLESSFEFNENDETVEVKNEVRELDSGRGTQSIRLQVPDNNVKDQYWINHIRLAWSESIEYSHTVEVVRRDEDKTNLLGLEFTIRPPTVIRELMMNLPCTHEGIPLTLPTRFGRNEVGNFVGNLISNPKRKWPVVLFTHNPKDDFKEYDKIYWDAAKKLAGLAIVVSANGSPATLALRSAIGNKHTPRNGSIGIYYLGFDSDDMQAEYSLMLPDRVQDRRKDPGGIVQHLIDTMSIRLAKTEIIRPLYQELREEEIAKQPTFQPGFKQESLFQRAIRRLRLLFQPNWKKQVSTLRNEVRTLSTERDRLIDDANSRFAVLELKLKESRDDLKLSKKQRNSLSKTNRRLSNQIDNFKKITKEAREEVETTEAEALEYRVGVGFLQAEIEEIRDEMEILEEQVREKHQLNTRIMEQLDGEIEKRSELTDELEKAKTENQVLKETILDDSVDDAKDMQYRKQISNLHKKYNEMESDRDEWKARHQNAAKDHRLSRQNLLDTNRDLERENAGLTADRHKLKQEAEAKNEEEGEFTNLLEALEQAEKDFARLYIFDEAKKSAKDSPFKNPQRAYDALEQMALTADEYIEERKGMSFLQSLQGVLSKRRVSVESPATMKKFNRKWKTVRGDNGKTVRVEMKNHYKLGNDFNNHQTCLRIYFILDEDSKKLCIGYCGKHPENYSTGKLS